MTEELNRPTSREQELREIAAFYDSQTEADELAEWESAWAERDKASTSIDVPTELAPLVRSLVAGWESLKRSATGSSAHN